MLAAEFPMCLERPPVSPGARAPVRGVSTLRLPGGSALVPLSRSVPGGQGHGKGGLGANAIIDSAQRLALGQ